MPREPVSKVGVGEVGGGRLTILFCICADLHINSLHINQRLQRVGGLMNAAISSILTQFASPYPNDSGAGVGGGGEGCGKPTEVIPQPSVGRSAINPIN